MEKKELTKIQIYAVQAANDKIVAARKELQEIINLVAIEMKLDTINEYWVLSADMQFLEKRNVPKKDKLHMHE